MTFGEQIRRAREAKNLSQEALAEALGVSRQAVSKWENGTAVPQGTNRTTLAEVLELEPEQKEPAPQKHSIALWLGWTVAAVLLLALIGPPIYRSITESSDSNPGSPEPDKTVTDPMDITFEEPSLYSVRFFDETQEGALFNDPEYSMALVDSILLQWTGNLPLETVKLFYAPYDGKTELAAEFKGPTDGSRAMLLPADCLYYRERAQLYFELHFAENYIITSEKIGIYFDENITIDAYIEDFDGQLLAYDKVEWVDFPSDRAGELGLEDPGGGFTIYNEQDAAAQRTVAEDCTYTVLDQNANFAPIAVSASEFQTILGARAWPGTPYTLTFRGNEIVAIRERYVP